MPVCALSCRPTQDTREKTTSFGGYGFQCSCREVSKQAFLSDDEVRHCLQAVATPQMPPMKIPNKLLTAKKLVKVVQKLVPICKAVMQILQVFKISI